MEFRNIFTTAIFILLLIWGPIDHESSSGMIIRFLYLILIPFSTFFILKWIWDFSKIQGHTERIFENILITSICIFLLFLAYDEFTSKTHWINTEQIPTHDGYEDVGEDIEVPGGNKGVALIWVLLSGIIFWNGVLKRKPLKS